MPDIRDGKLISISLWACHSWAKMSLTNSISSCVNKLPASRLQYLQDLFTIWTYLPNIYLPESYSWRNSWSAAHLQSGCYWHWIVEIQGALFNFAWTCRSPGIVSATQKYGYNCYSGVFSAFLWYLFLTVSINVPLSQVLTQNIPGKKRGVNTVKSKSLLIYLLKNCSQCHSLCSGHSWCTGLYPAAG